MIIHLPTEIENSIQAAVHSGHFASVDAAMTKAASLLLQQLKQEQGAATHQVEAVPAHKPIWEVFQQLSADVPDEVWDSLPPDLSEQHDHYIYGTPKRPVE